MRTSMLLTINVVNYQHRTRTISAHCARRPRGSSCLRMANRTHLVVLLVAVAALAPSRAGAQDAGASDGCSPDDTPEQARKALAILHSAARDPDAEGAERFTMPTDTVVNGLPVIEAWSASDLATEQEQTARAVRWGRVLACAAPRLSQSEREDAKRMIDDVIEWATAWRDALKGERAIRSDDRKAAARVCELIEQRRIVGASIARERGNPAGVVDLALLHDLGDQARSLDEAIAARRVTFARDRGKTFAASMCR